MAIRKGKIKRAKSISRNRQRNLKFRRSVAIVLNSMRGNALAEPQVVTTFVERVITDGGVIEGQDCLSALILALGYSSLNEETETIISDFTTRILSDSGIYEGINCLSNEIIKLKNI